jgi:hypothetical protein
MRITWHWFLVLLAVFATACGDDDSFPDSAPAGEDRFDCVEWVAPEREDPDSCSDPDLSQPDRLRRCERGSGHFGRWSVDAAGLPAYDFIVEQRCDPIASAWTPRTTPLRDPVHLVGNGRGLVAMARASGAVEIYSQDRGHKWINRVDLWSDPADPGYPPQLGGGFSYYTVRRSDGTRRVGSTRFEDLPTNRATEMQTRRFGVGYFETITRESDIVVHRRVVAPDTTARALVAEVTVENPTNRTQDYEIIEFWDLNQHQIPLELITSDVAFPGVTERIDRRRRQLAASFTQRIEWQAAAGVATAFTTAKSLPPGVATAADVGRYDSFPEPVYLAVLDDPAEVDAVWLADNELWSDNDRRPPAAVASAGAAAGRVLEIDGAGQRGLLAVRVPLRVEPRSQVTRRFAFGYVPGGADPDADVAELRAAAADLGEEAVQAWRERMVWAAFPGLPEAGVVQRELAWAAYNALAHTTFDEYRGTRLLGQGGSYKYIHGMDGAMGDLALFADAVTLLDPDVAADTLAYALASQHGSTSPTPWRFPYATTGVGNFTDVGIYNQRSDAYFFLPASIGRYVGLTRDFAFLGRDLPYWPRAAGESAPVLGHLERTLAYARDSLGIGARGLTAMGTGDYADGVLALTEEVTTPQGTSSTYNAGMVVHGFPEAAAVIERADAEIAAAMQALADDQAEALLTRASQGEYFHRGFVDNGNPLAPEYFFLEPQLFPVLADLLTPAARDAALDAVVRILETDIGAVSNVAIDTSGPVAGPDQPLVGGVWPVANAWLSEAYARRDADEGWSSFVRNTLAAHARAYPDLWYGIWTGPDSFNGPEHPRPGEADAHPATALTDYPALNMHVHTSPLRALAGLVGIEPTATGIAITPRVPSERFSVHWPRLGIDVRRDSIGGYYVARDAGGSTLDVALPGGLRDRATVAVTIDGQVSTGVVQDGRVVIALPGRNEAAVAWRITR